MNRQVKIEVFSANDLSFTCRTCGLEQQGELIIFLHGFPESSIIWEKLMQTMAEKGYRCLAPNQRGYSDGARPEGIENYTNRALATDIVALADTVGNAEKFHLVGHDWGAAIGWTVVTLYPERIVSWSALSVPHSAAYNWALSNDKVQREKSQYIFTFMEPEVPESLLGANDCERLRKLWEGFDQNFIEDYLKIFRQKEARTATINWYRAAFKTSENGDSPAIPNWDVHTPTLFIWGSNDLAIAKAGVELSHTYMKGDYKFIELDAGHWLMQFNDEICIKEIAEHIEKHKE